MFKWPKSNADFWRKKIEGNVANDSKTGEALAEDGWRVLTVWECSLKGRGRLPLEELAGQISGWLHHGTTDLVIAGTKEWMRTGAAAH